MKLSIVTINYNNANHLNKTISSVINQSTKAFEYIVIDGGSNDDSVSVIKENAEHINYWVSEEDHGIYNAMNKGIKVAKGEYILFLNSGDWFYDNDVIKNVLPKLNHTDIIYGNVISYYNENKQSVNSGFGKIKPSLRHFFQGYSLPHPATFHKKSLFEEYGYYDENLKIVSDWKFFIEALVKHNATISYIDITISYFDMQGISNANEKLIANEHSIVLNDLFGPKIYEDYKYLYSLKDKLKSKRIKKMEAILSHKLGKKVFTNFLNISFFLFGNKKTKADKQPTFLD